MGREVCGAPLDVLGQIAGGPTVYGHRPEDVVAGAAAGIGSTYLRVVFINPAPGAPIPDLLQLTNAPEAGQELKTLVFGARLSGPMALDGSPGNCTIMQEGVLSPGESGRVVVGDGFTAEFIDLKRTGR